LVVLRWLLQQDNVIVLSRSTNPDRIASNTRLFDVTLSPIEVAAIYGLVRDGSRIVDPLGLAPSGTRCRSEFSDMGLRPRNASTARGDGVDVGTFEHGSRVTGGRDVDHRLPEPLTRGRETGKVLNQQWG
jgi:hypothetical protein